MCTFLWNVNARGCFPVPVGEGSEKYTFAIRSALLSSGRHCKVDRYTPIPQTVPGNSSTPFCTGTLQNDGINARQFFGGPISSRWRVVYAPCPSKFTEEFANSFEQKKKNDSQPPVQKFCFFLFFAIEKICGFILFFIFTKCTSMIRTSLWSIAGITINVGYSRSIFFSFPYYF